VLTIPLPVTVDDNNFEIIGSVDRDELDLDTFVDSARLGFKRLQILPKARGLKLRWQLEFDLPTNSLASNDVDRGDAALRKGQINL